jgi:hypothetical protein
MCVCASVRRCICVCLCVCVSQSLSPILPQEGDHVSIWFSGDVEVCRGWYDGKVSKKMKTRSRARSNVDVWFLEDDGGVTERVSLQLGPTAPRRRRSSAVTPSRL